mmetsp:Transcript_15358/g.39573  ORF Transcript_15358/g.39573 Transcript_15358/m.39573 type:complete len:258 (-) Transcript_15358:25-798(-)
MIPRFFILNRLVDRELVVANGGFDELSFHVQNSDLGRLEDQQQRVALHFVRDPRRAVDVHLGVHSVATLELQLRNLDVNVKLLVSFKEGQRCGFERDLHELLRRLLPLLVGLVDLCKGFPDHHHLVLKVELSRRDLLHRVHCNLLQLRQTDGSVRRDLLVLVRRLLVDCRLHQLGKVPNELPGDDEAEAVLDHSANHILDLVWVRCGELRFKVDLELGYRLVLRRARLDDAIHTPPNWPQWAAAACLEPCTRNTAAP